MQLVRSGIAVGAGFLVFSILFTLIGPGLGAVLTTGAAGLMAGYLTAKIAPSHELTHGGATAGLVAASLMAQPTFPVGVRIVVALLSAIAIAAGAWVRAHAHIDRPDNPAPGHAAPGRPGDSRRPTGDGREGHS